ncbi:MAG TPA: SEC-C metal-binding domain-containing protein [Tepidisphaeraceae bacterium]|nr:SEC-C metal-binding domain-containing protein [Tepidisphaeraceae bacterium]
MDRTQILSDYLALRPRLIELNGALVEMLSADDIKAAASRLGILHGKQITLDTEDQSAVLMDYAIHDVFHGEVNAVERMYRQTPPPPDSVQMRLLLAMRRQRYSIVRVQEVVRKLGVMGLEGTSTPPTLIVDQGFSKTAQVGMGLCTRLISPGADWSMTTGASMPLTEPALKRIMEEFNDYIARHGHEPKGSLRTTMLVNACVAAGASHAVRYADVNASGADGQVATIRRAAPKPGRNDPCSCGSGRKYKKCCGVSE